MSAVIRTYGLFWDNTLVHWTGKRGPGGKRFQLLGSLNSRETKENRCVDFYEQVGFYALYDQDKKVIYLGQAGGGKSRLGSRLSSHLADDLMGRWRYFSWFGLGWIKQNNALDAEANTFTLTRSEILDPFEGVLINLVEPPLNLQRGNLRRYNILRYFQYGQHKKWLNISPTHAAESP